MAHQFESHLGHTIIWQKLLARAGNQTQKLGRESLSKMRPSNVTPFVLEDRWTLDALTDQRCDGLATRRSENVWAWPMSSTKLSNHSSRNARLRPISKRKLSSSDAAESGNVIETPRPHGRVQRTIAPSSLNQRTRNVYGSLKSAMCPSNL